MATCNFSKKNARYIYALEDDSAKFFEGSEWNEKGFEFHGLPVGADVEIFVNPGYYEGANIDYEIMFEGYKLSDYECIDDLLFDFRDYYEDVVELNPGMAVIQWRTFCNRFRKFAESVIGKVEDYCRESCDQVLKVAGVFSNGAAVYSVVK